MSTMKIKSYYITSIFMAEEPVPESMPAGANEQIPSEGQVQQGVTVFDNDGAAVVSQPVDLLSTLLHPRDHVEGAETIIDFLKRPAILFQGTLTTGDTTYIWSGDPFVLLSGGIKAAKLVGIYGMKADMIITLNVNATRFMTGRYILGWLPSGGSLIASTDFAASIKVHATALMNITQLPHVEIDVASQTSVELRIPWQNQFPYWVNRSTPVIGTGMLFIYPYSALTTGAGDNAAGFTLWGAYDNIELTGPTITQSSFVGSREAKKAGIGPVESALAKVSKASNILGEIPLLAPATRTVGWATSVLARAAHVFGWSKPTDLATPMMNKPQYTRYFPNWDGASTAQPIAGSSTNSLVSNPPNNISGVDEMSIDFLKSIYAFYEKDTWGTQIAGDQITSIPIRPTWYKQAYGLSTLHTPVAFLGTLFNYWRGGLKFRFKLVKNEFYSGRLAVAFIPTWHGTAQAMTLTTSEYAHRIIIDIRSANEFEFEVPYISPDLWTAQGNPIGFLKVLVVDPLVAPDSVAPTIQIIIEVAGAPDLAFGMPCNPQWNVTVPFTSQADFHSLGKSSNAGLAPEMVSMGEKVESLRQLWRVPYNLRNASSSNGLWSGSASTFVMVPYNIDVTTQPTSISTAFSNSGMLTDLYGLFSSLYLFNTGSMRVLISTASSGTFGVGLSTTTNLTTWSSSTTSFFNTNMVKWYMNSGTEPLDIEVPAYYWLLSRVVSNSWMNDGTTQLVPSNNANKLGLYVQSVNAANHFIQRQPADNANCFGFLSIPAVSQYGA